MSLLNPNPPRERTDRIVVRGLKAMKSRYRKGLGASIGDLLRSLGPRAAALTSALIAIPFLWPMGLGPLSWPGCIAMAILGLTMMRGSGSVELPDTLMATTIPERVHGVMRRFVFWVRRFRHYSKPRHKELTEGRFGQVLCGAAVVFGAILLALPIPLIPFTNTLPAIGLILFTIGWSEQDGLLTLGGIVAYVVSLAYFGLLALLATSGVLKVVDLGAYLGGS